MSRYMKFIVLTAFLAVLAAGCSVKTSRDLKTSGLFKNPNAFVDVMSRIESGKTTIYDFQKIGLNINPEDLKKRRLPEGVKNVLIVPGEQILKIIYGQEFFQGAGTDPDKIEKLNEFTNSQFGLIFTEEDIFNKTTKYDIGVYSKTTGNRQGPNYAYALLIKGAVVVKVSPMIELIDVPLSESRIGYDLLGDIIKDSFKEFLREQWKSFKKSQTYQGLF